MLWDLLDWFLGVIDGLTLRWWLFWMRTEPGTEPR